MTDYFIYLISAMKAININFIVSSFFLFGFFIGSASKNNDGFCNTADLSFDDIITCNGKNPDDAFFPSITNGTLCEVRCQSDGIIGNALCKDAQWQTDCHLPRRKRFLGFLSKAAKAFFGIFTDHRRPRDNTAPSLTCPPDIRQPADKLQVNAWVHWDDTVYAFDNRDGQIRAIRHGLGPGFRFQGINYVTYTARDRAGNMNSCQQKIEVYIKRCKRLPPINNGYHICYPVDENRYGTTCNFGCYDGFELKGGSSHLECLMNQQWSGSIPYCEKIKCKDLPPVNKPLSFTCTDGNNYRSVCNYKCDLGYDIEPGMTRVRVCSANKQWRGDAPKCRDTEPPKISNCTGAFYNIADRNSLEGSAYWIEPSVSDNSNELIKPILAGNIKPGDKITSGVYKIRYHAQDKAGNKAFECKMKILMKVLRCSNIFATPFMTVKCPDGVRYGAKCQFECDVGTQINGTRDAVCESVHDKYSEWTYGTTQPFCEMMEKCQKVPRAPKNGALACDNWLGGQLCQLQCKKGYDVKPGFPFYDMLVCDVDKGTWGPKDFLPLPDCTTSILTSKGIVQQSFEYYFSGDCNDASTQKEIQTNFISALKSSLYRDGCLIYAKDCNIANVKVYCGSKKRSTTTRINFDIDVTFGNDSFKSEFSEFRRNLHTIFTNIQDSIDEGKLDIKFGQNQTLNMKAVALTGGDLELHCGGNTVPSYTSLSCIECSPGTFYDGSTCHRCPRGKYQPNSGRSDCIKCPFGQKTSSIGSTSKGDCQDGCHPGYWSPNGIPPCSPCFIGTYIDNYGSNICKKCRGSKTTESEGSTNDSDCKEFDVVLTSDNSSIDATISIDKDTTDFSITFWLQQDDNSSTSISFKNDRDVIVLELNFGPGDFYLQNERNKTLIETFAHDTRWNYHVVSAFMDKTVIRRNETEFILPDKVELDRHIKTVAIAGQGQVSQLNIWSETQIQNKRAIANTRKCFNEDEGDIFSWKIFENSNGNNAFIQTPSECDDTDECLGNPCNNGDCTDEGNTFSCRCHYGFEGDTCEHNIDDCVGNACENNGTCIDGPANYTCLCQSEFTGDLCETRMVNGNWSEWLEWSDCSATCGNGTQIRKRLCNNPMPDNGGLYCEGSDVDILNCYQIPHCPVCSNLTEPNNSTLTCHESESGNINCTLECHEGFEFDQVPKSYYLCGPDTFHQWDFQTEENPLGRLPFCSAIQYGDSLSVRYKAQYQNLKCDSEEKRRSTMTAIPNRVQNALRNLACFDNGLCELAAIKITDCSLRQKRSTVVNTAGFQVEFRCDSNVFGTDACVHALQYAVQQVQLLAQNKSLEAQIHNSWYDIILNKTTAAGLVNCPKGSVQVSYFCVPCSEGKHMRNGICEKCETGTYQDETGQTSCKACPVGRTSVMKGSISAQECTVPLETEKEGFTSGEIVAMVMGSLILIAVVFVVWIKYQKYKLKQKPEVRILQDQAYTIASKPAKNVGRFQLKEFNVSGKEKM